MFFWSARTAPAISTVAPKASIVYYPLDSSRHNLRRDGHQQGGQRDGRSNSRDLHPAPASTIPVIAHDLFLSRLHAVREWWLAFLTKR